MMMMMILPQLFFYDENIYLIVHELTCLYSRHFFNLHSIFLFCEDRMMKRSRDNEPVTIGKLILSELNHATLFILCKLRSSFVIDFKLL